MTSPMVDRKLDCTMYTNLADGPTTVSTNAKSQRCDITRTRLGWTVHRSLSHAGLIYKNYK